MKRIFLTAAIVITTVAFIGCLMPKKITVPIPDGYQGIYVVKIWEGDNSVLPKGLTGLTLKRVDDSYKIILSNIDVKKKQAEEIEELEYTYVNGEFLIKFGELMKVKPVKNGLSGTLSYDGKPAKLFLKKIK